MGEEPARGVVVVSDTSPILNLFLVEHLDLLRKLFGEIVIPPSVANELTSYGAVVDGDRMRGVAERDREELSRMQLLLDSGEAEAIVVAIEICAGLLLADERRGRREAAARGLRVTGILGVLAHAKERGFISSRGSVLDEMIVHAGFWIGEELRVQLLSGVGEAP